MSEKKEDNIESILRKKYDFKILLQYLLTKVSGGFELRIYDISDYLSILPKSFNYLIMIFVQCYHKNFKHIKGGTHGIRSHIS